MSLYKSAHLLKCRRPQVFQGLFHFNFQRRQSSAGDGPYRPWPTSEFMYQGAIQHYDAIHKPPSAKDDEFEKEEVYLDEIEERMKKYDKKYRNTDEYNALWNEFGWEDQTDRPFVHYGTPNEEGAQFGRGKKINPSNYINGDLYSPVKRQPIPPVQFLTAEQVRRSRGSLANFRELPPEAPSVWKTWNGHAVFATFLALWLTKEQVVFTSHDVWEGILTWSFFGVGMAIFADWFTWIEGTAVQEQFDRKYFAATEAVKELHEKLEALATKPDEKQALLSLMAYRETLSEKVLQKSLSNRVSRIIDGTLKKLQDKISEEASVQRETEKQFHKQALEGTLRQLDQKSERDTFTAEALQQFATLDKDKLSSESVVFDVDLFRQTYERFLQAAKDAYLQEQQANNTLPWAFRSNSDRESARLSPEQKEREYLKRVREWEQGRNNVDAPVPSFA